MFHLYVVEWAGGGMSVYLFVRGLTDGFLLIRSFNVYYENLVLHRSL